MINEIKISRDNPSLLRHKEIPAEPEVYVESHAPKDKSALICGKLEYWKSDGQITYYHEKVYGPVWIYLTDCHGTVDAGMQHTCVPGNVLSVDGCHAFGCDRSNIINLRGVKYQLHAIPLPPEMPQNCRGNACPFLDVAWVVDQFVFTNTGAHTMRLGIQPLIGFSIGQAQYYNIPSGGNITSKQGYGGDLSAEFI